MFGYFGISQTVACFCRLARANKDMAELSPCYFGISLTVDCFCRLARANKDMAELNRRLFDAAFGSEGSFVRIPSMNGADGKHSKAGHDKETKNQLKSSSIDPATSSSDDLATLNELPPGIPVESLMMTL